MDDGDRAASLQRHSDEELMRAAGSGDRVAFGCLVKRHDRCILQFVHRFLGTSDPHLAEDLAQEALLGAWAAADSFEPRAKVLTWLLRITMNRCLNYRRGSKLRKTVSLDVGRTGGQIPASSASAEERVLADEQAEHVRATVGQLPPNQRAAVLLRHFHDLAYSEIAQVLDVSVSAVESLLFRARTSMREGLRAAGNRPGEQV